MGLAHWSIILLMAVSNLRLINALPSKVAHLEPVLGSKMTFKEEPAEVLKKRQESNQPFPSTLSIEFQAFGSAYSYELEVHRELTEGAKMSFYGADDNLINEVPFEHKVYRGFKKNEAGEEIGWINLVALEDGLFSALVSTDDQMFVVEPLAAHESELDPVAKRDLASMSDLVIYRLSDVHIEGLMAGLAVPNHLARRDNNESSVEAAAEGRIGRNLQTVTKWTNCFPNGGVARRFDVFFYMDYGHYASAGGTQAKAMNHILWILSNANMIYYVQVNVFLFPGSNKIMTAANGDGFNNGPGCTDINGALEKFRVWRTTQANDNDGIYHILTSCSNSQAAGIGYVGVTGDKNWGVAASSFQGWRTWLVFAHENGHNFGANHAFQDGQGTTGGIMDYGDGKYQGEYQFHPVYNRPEVCGHITWSMGRTDSAFVKNTWKIFTPKCGNGVIEPGEDCDDTTSCCVNCKMAPGAVCLNGPCCQNCQYLPTSTRCSDAQSFCSNGQCVGSVCTWYSNTKLCGITPSNPCKNGCTVNGGTYCYPGSGISLPDNLADGLVCNTAPYSTCLAGACKPATNSWVTGAWSTCALICGAETQTRTVQCKRSDGAVVADSLCSGTKPATSQACPNPACTSLTFTWTKASGPCSSTACNTAGTITNTITCMVDTRTVDVSYCTSYARNTKPAATEACQGPCAGTWNIGSWSTCNLVCGSETQTRTVQCRLPNNTVIADSNCFGSKAATSQACPNPTCASSTFTWGKVSGPCSATTCNAAGTITNTLTCTVNGTRAVDVSYCTSYARNTKPAATESCTGACTGTWSIGSWDACTRLCGSQTTNRTVTCKKSDGTVVADSNCAGAKPATSQACSLPSCTSSQFIFQWKIRAGTCSATRCNATGTVTDLVVCKLNGTKDADESYCNCCAKNANNKPTVTPRSCLGPCTAKRSSLPITEVKPEAPEVAVPAEGSNQASAENSSEVPQQGAFIVPVENQNQAPSH